MAKNILHERCMKRLLDLTFVECGAGCAQKNEGKTD